MDILAADGEDEDSSVHFGCYIYTATSEERPTKRRRANGRPSTLKVVLEKDEKPIAQLAGFPRLLNQQEPEECIQLRTETYHALWKDVEERTNVVLEQVNEETLQQVSQFVLDAEPALYNDKLPTALILAGPNIASHTSLFAQLSNRIDSVDKIGPVVVLTSKDATNLKNVLKKVIAEASEDISTRDEDEDEAAVMDDGKKYLNYDPEKLCQWCIRYPESKVVVAVQDTEAFDTAILADLISLFYQYLDRIPFVLLLGIATSEEIFNDKLPKSTIRLMRGERFDVQRFEESIEQIFDEAVASSRSSLKLGPVLCDSLFGRLKEHTMSTQSFISSLKYAYMSHFYANPLSMLLHDFENVEEMGATLTADHVEAVRNLPSFRRFIESALKESKTDDIKATLEDDDYTRRVIWDGLENCRIYAASLPQGLAVFQLLLDSTNTQHKTELHRYELYSRALFGDFLESPIYRDVILSVKKMNSESLQALMVQFLIEITHLPILEKRIQETLAAMEKLTAEKVKSKPSRLTNLDRQLDMDLVAAKQAHVPVKQLVSEFNLENDIMRTTVKAGRVRLDELKKSLTKQDVEYSNLVKSFTDDLESYFAPVFQGIDDVFLHEVFFYDLASPHRDVFAARTRVSVERALSRPQDYLACECCTDAEAGEELIATQPATSIVYQLYLNAGSLINIFDMWTAFFGIVGDEEMEDEEREKLQALFYRALAELRYLGMIKYSKRKTDHLVKLAWKGL